MTPEQRQQLEERFGLGEGEKATLRDLYAPVVDRTSITPDLEQHPALRPEGIVTREQSERQLRQDLETLDAHKRPSEIEIQQRLGNQPDPVDPGGIATSQGGPPPPQPRIGGYGLAGLQGRARRTTRDAQRGLAESQTKIGGAIDEQRGAMDNQADLAEQRGMEEARIRKGYMDEAQRLQAEDDQFRQDHAAKLEDVRRRFDEASSQEVDTGRFRREHRGQYILAGIAAGLVDMGNIMAGGQAGAGSKFFQMMQQKAREDIEEQRRQIADGKEGAENDLSILTQEFGDHFTASKALEGRIYMNMAQDIDVLKSEYTGPEVRAQLDQAKGELTQQAEEARGQGIARQHQIGMQGIGAETQIAGARQQGAIAAAKARGGGQGYQLEGYVQGGKTTTTKAAFDRAQKAAAAAYPAIDAIKRAKEIREKYGAEAFSRGTVAEADVLRSDLASMIGQLGSAGVMSQEEVKRYKEMVGDPTGIGFQTARLDAVENLVKRRLDGAARAAGLVPQTSQTTVETRPAR